MRKNITAILITVFAATSLAAAGASLTTAEMLSTAQPVTLQTQSMATGEESGLQSRYKIGSTVNIPRGEIIVSGKGYDAQTVVIEPNGKAYVADSVVADHLGEYTIEYRVTVEGELYTERTSFETYNDLYTVTGNGTASFGKETRYGTGIEGLQVSLHDGEEFRFNEIIDLRELDYETPFIDLFATPNTLGQRDVHAFTMRLTDAYDPENYVTIDAKSVNTDGGSNLWWMNFIFVAAGARGNSLKGIEWGKNLVHVDNSFGFPIKYSLYGTIDNQNSVGTNFFQLCYDLAENKIYGPLGKAENYAIDLDDPQYFVDGWKGFTTGEVYLTLSGTSYYAPSFEFTIRKIGNSDLSEETICDRTKPDIRIDCSEVPIAGLYNDYPVFAATALDGYSGEIPVTTKVFYNYRGENRYELPIEEGKFLPVRKGTYTIEYSATDSAGNTATETISVVCDGVDRTLGLEIGAIPMDCKTGIRVSLARVHVSGGVGSVALKTTVRLSEEEIPVRNGTFIPQKEGTYVVEVTATDFGGQTAKESYSIEVARNDRPVIADASFPDYMVTGGTYRIPALSAYNSMTNETMPCLVQVNGKELQGSVYTVPDDALSVEIVYSAGGETKRYSVPVLKYSSPASLFVSEGGAEDSADGVVISGGSFLFANELDSELNIVVFVQGGGKLSLTIVDFLDSTQATTITLTSGQHVLEYRAAEKKITVDGKAVSDAVFEGGVRLSGNVTGSAVIEEINGQAMGTGAAERGTVIAVDGYYALKVGYGSSFEVLTAKGYNVLRPDEACTVSVTDPSGRVLIRNAQADERYSVEVTSLGRYTVVYTAGEESASYSIQAVDRTAPTITIVTMSGNLTQSVKVGNIVNIPYAKAKDDRDGEVETICFIISPDGMISTAEQRLEDRTEAGMLVRFAEPGKYTIRYMAVDACGNYAVLEYVLTVTA